MNANNMWQDVVGNNRAADGRFVYAVRSTGIYCRPSCSSRRPKRENVEFFDLAEAAENGGYRPCKRCRPNEAEIRDEALNRVHQACRYIAACLEESLDGPPSLRAITNRAQVWNGLLLMFE